MYISTPMSDHFSCFFCYQVGVLSLEMCPRRLLKMLASIIHHIYRFCRSASSPQVLGVIPEDRARLKNAGLSRLHIPFSK
jgi:hypothetical protein